MIRPMITVLCSIKDATLATSLAVYFVIGMFVKDGVEVQNIALGNSFTAG